MREPSRKELSSMPLKSGCFIPRRPFRGMHLVCSGAVLLAALSAAPSLASLAPLAARNMLQIVLEKGLPGSPGALPLLVKTEGEALDFRARDVAGPPGRPIPLKIDVPDGEDTETGKLFIFSGLPQGVTLNPGGNFGDFWAVNASVVKDLTLTAPPNFSGTFTVLITRSRNQATAAQSASITVTIGQPDTTPTASAAPTFPERQEPPAKVGAGARAVPPNEQMLMSRADATFKKGDVSGARVIYEYLAMQGSAMAAMAMGETYDPLVLNKLVIKGLTPDAAKARQWYEKAEQLGSGDARTRLNALAAR
jgi:hypothetical protein